MHYQKSQSLNQILTLINIVLAEPVLSSINPKVQEKLIISCKNYGNISSTLQIIDKLLKSNQEVAIRLKLLCITHRIISFQNDEQILDQMSFIFSKYQSTAKKQREFFQDQNTINSYLHHNVQIPYLSFLRKVVTWRSIQIAYDDVKSLDYGFTLINKIKDIGQIRKIFHNYGCYYSNHFYAFNIFKQILSTLKHLWNQICQMAKDIISQVMTTDKIISQEYLFLSSAQQAQEILIQFVYGNHFIKKINEQQKIKTMIFLTPQIKNFQMIRKKKILSQQALKILSSKRESRKQIQGYNQNKTGSSDNLQQKMSTQMEMDIIQSILRMQQLINQ